MENQFRPGSQAVRITEARRIAHVGFMASNILASISRVENSTADLRREEGAGRDTTIVRWRGPVVTKLVFLVEEPSMADLLDRLLPRLFPELSFCRTDCLRQW